MNNDDIFELVDGHGGWSMSDFQSRYFVVNSQVTNYRRVRQALLEIETRIAAVKQIERSSKRTEIERKIKQRDYDKETDELLKELIAVDLEQLDYDLSQYSKKYRVAKEELNKFADIVKDVVPDIQALESFKEHNELEERKYWITRMGKQAAMDLMTIGRISQGNMDSISMMPIDDQKQTVKAAMKYNAVMGKGFQQLEQEAVQEIGHDQKIDYIDELVNEQLKIETKVQGEDI